jgi:hypothetical protein
MQVYISMPFKSMELDNGEKLNLSVSRSSLNEVIQRLVATNDLTVEELAILIIGQLKLCDSPNLNTVLPEAVWKKLISTYETVKNGDRHE